MHLKRLLSSRLLEDETQPQDYQADPAILFDLVAERFAIGSWRLDVNTGDVWWSEKVFRIHGMQPQSGPVNLEDAIRKYHSSDATTVGWLVMQALKLKSGYTFVLRLTQPDGRVKLVESRARYLPAGQNQGPQLVGTFRDVSKEMSQSELLANRKQVVVSIIENSPVPVVVLDRQLNYVEVSPAWARYVGAVDAEALLGKNHLQEHPYLGASWRKRHSVVLQGDVVSDTLGIRPKDQDDDRLQSVSFPWKTMDGGVGGIVMMLSKNAGDADTSQSLEQIAAMFTDVSAA